MHAHSLGCLGRACSRGHVALAGILAPGPHQRLVLAHPQPLALHDAGAFRPWLVLVVRVLLKVLPAQPRLLLIVGLLLLVGHGLPTGAWPSPQRQTVSPGLCQASPVLDNSVLKCYFTKVFRCRELAPINTEDTQGRVSMV